MKKLIMMVLGLMCAVGMAGMAIAGNIDSPGAPSSGSGMYTLQQVYNYLSAGTTATIPGSFQEPSAGPGSTMKTTKEIVAAVATPFAQVNGPAAADVKSGVKFFSTAPGSWGIRTGTGLMQPTPTPTPTITPTPAVTPTPEVVVLAGMEVARFWNGIGCNSGNLLTWSDAKTWADGLEWLGRSDWRLPTGAEIYLGDQQVGGSDCQNHDMLTWEKSGDYNYFWSADATPDAVCGSGYSWAGYHKPGVQCGHCCVRSTTTSQVRAVRTH